MKSLHIKHFTEPIQDVQTAMKIAGLDWTVSEDFLTNPRNGEPTGIKLIYRDGTNQILGQATDRYRLVQNVEHFSYLTNFATDNGYKFIGMGNRDGQIFAQIQTGEHNVGGLSPTKKIVTGLFSHDGSIISSYHPTSTVIVCQNTFLANVREAKGADSLRFKKTKGIREKMENGLVLIELAKTENNTLMGIFDMLTRIAMSPAQLKDFVLNSLYPIKEDAKTKRAANIHDEIIEFMEDNDKNAMPELKGTAWTAFNAVTRFFNHNGDDDSKSKLSAEEKQIRQVKRQFNVIHGDAAKNQRNAFDLVLEYAQTQTPRGFSEFSFPTV